jgi:cytochrome P450
LVTDTIAAGNQTQPPLIPGLPILGNAPALAKSLIPFIVEQYKRVGPIFRVRALNQEMVILAGPEANAFIVQEGADKFSSWDSWYDFGHEFDVESQMQCIDGEAHIRMRKLLKNSYSVNALMSNIPLMIDIADKVLDRFQVGEEVGVLSLFRLIVTEQLGRMLANHAPGDDLESLIISIRTALNVHATKQWPSFMLRLPAYQRAKKRYFELGQKIVEKHRTTSREKPDLVDTVLSASQKEEFQSVFGTEEQIRFAALGPFIAGLDTVANECAFMLFALLKHPAILQECVEEADRLFANGTPDLARLRSHGVLHYAMMETLRCYSIAPAITRTAARDFEFAGYQVKKGQKMIIATTAAHFLPELFAEPDTFDITRYSEPRKEHKKRGAYAPFGIGTHLCLGAGAAEAQMVLVMAIFLHLVRPELAKPGEKLAIKNDPTPTLGHKFRIRIAERRIWPATDHT